MSRCHCLQDRIKPSLLLTGVAVGIRPMSEIELTETGYHICLTLDRICIVLVCAWQTCVSCE